MSTANEFDHTPGGASDTTTTSSNSRAGRSQQPQQRNEATDADSLSPPDSFPPPFLTSSTFDPSQPRSLVDIPHGLGFTASHGFRYQRSRQQQQEEQEAADEEEEEDDDEDESEQSDDNDEARYYRAPEEEEAIDRMQRAVGIQSDRPSSSSSRVISSGRLQPPSAITGAVDSASSAPSSSRRLAPPPSSTTPLLPSSSTSPFSSSLNSPPLIGPSIANTPSAAAASRASSLHAQPAAAAAAALIASDSSFQPFTPQTRRHFLKHKIDLVKLHNAQQRKNKYCPLWLGSMFACCCPGTKEGENPFTRRRLIVLLLFLWVVASYGLELVLRKIVAAHLYNYRWFLYEFMALGTFLVSAAVAVKNRVAVRHFIKHYGVPFRFLFLSSLLDSIHSLSLLLAVGILPPLWGITVAQLVIPMSLLLRFFATNGERGSRVTVLGSLLILVAVLVSFIPTLEGFHTCPALDPHVNRRNVRQELIVNLMILSIGLVPLAVSHIYKQTYLQHNAINGPFMNACLSAGSLVWGMLLSPFALQLQYEGNSGIETGTASFDLPLGTSNPVPAPPRAAHVGGKKPSVTRSALDYGSNVSGDMASSWYNGLRCLFSGDSSQLGDDSCADFFPWILLGVLLFCLVQAMTQLSVSMLMAREKRERVVAASLTGGVLFAVLLFQSPFLLWSLLPSWEMSRCMAAAGLFWHPATLVAVLALAAGMTAAQWTPSQEPMDLDVWGRLEEVAEEEEIEKNRRARMSAMNLSASQSASSRNSSSNNLRGAGGSSNNLRGAGVRR